MEQPIDVSDGVILHLHADEILADAEMQWEGKGRIIGLEDAERLFPSKVEKRTPAWWREQRQVCLGNGGDFSDEHRNGAAERIRGTSACKIMAERLQITNPVILKMVEEVNYFDSHIGCPKTHLASIIKMVKLFQAGSDSPNYKRFIRFINAIRETMEKDLPPTKREKPLKDFAAHLMSRKSSYDNEAARQGLIELIEKESDATEPFVFSLRHLYESLWRTSPGDTLAQKVKEIGDEMLWLLSVLYWDQINFHTFLSIAQSKDFEGVFWVNVWDGQRTVKIKACFAQTDNPQAHNAMRSAGACLTIVKTSSGNVTVLGNIKQAQERKIITAMDIGIQNLVAMNRFLDMPPAEQTSAYWELLKSRGNSPKDDKWYLGDQDWLAIYNGTQNHASSSTDISAKRLRANAQVAFDPKAVEEWKQVNGVPQSWLKPVLNMESWLKPVSLESDLRRVLA